MSQATERGGCDQCQMIRINGIRCHELGCPVQRRLGERRDCGTCGGLRCVRRVEVHAIEGGDSWECTECMMIGEGDA